MRLTPYDVGASLSQNESSREEIIRHLPEFVETINNFWDHTGEAAFAHVQDMHEELKGVFGGGLFPAHNENIASKCGLYTDTLVLPDPFLRSKYTKAKRGVKKPPAKKTQFIDKPHVSTLRVLLGTQT